MVDYLRLPHVESGSKNEKGLASRQNRKALEVKSKRKYKSKKKSGKDSDKEINELNRLLRDFGKKSNKNSSKDSGKKSNKESAKKSDKKSSKKSDKESSRKSNKDSGKTSDKDSGKKSDKESTNKSDKKSSKKSIKDSNKEKGQEPDNNNTNRRQTSSEKNREDKSSIEHTKATRYTKKQKEEITRVRKYPKKDYYAILGLEENYSRTKIKKAYKKILLLTHPDKNKYKDTKKAFKS
jgi:hypothetical protein